MMVWVNAIAILVSAYVFAYGLVRVGAIVLPRLLPHAISPLPLGMMVSISVIGFCMVTGTPGPVIFGMILVAIAAARSALGAGGAALHRIMLLIAAVLVGSVFLTHEALQIDGVAPYILAAMAVGAVAGVSLVLDHSQTLAKTLLIGGSTALIAAPIVLPAPYHVAIDGALVLIGMAAFGHAARHIRIAITLDRAFILPSVIIVAHGVLVAITATVKGL